MPDTLATSAPARRIEAVPPNDDAVITEFTRISRTGRLAVLTIRWDGRPHSPRSRWVTLRKRPDGTDSTDPLALRRALLRDARYFGICTRCGERKPTGWMQGDDSCQSCAERFDGVVY